MGENKNTKSEEVAENLKNQKTVETNEKNHNKKSESSKIDKTKTNIAKTLKKDSSAKIVYDETSIQHLDGLEHIRMRPGMYIGSLGDGSNENDGIYILFKEGVDNAVDEFSQGFGKKN